MPSGSETPRTWESTLYGASMAEARQMLETKGYVAGGSGIGSYDEWRDVEPRHGTTSSSFHVIEDPARPIIDALVERFGG